MGQSLGAGNSAEKPDTAVDNILIRTGEICRAKKRGAETDTVG